MNITNYTNKDELKFYSIQPGRLPIFIISGLAGVGKTTLARIMSNLLMPVITNSNRFRQSVLSFATPIKQCAYEVFGWDGKKDEKGRKLLQVLGTEAGRNYNEDIWVNKFINIIFDEDIHLTHNAVFIDDWRFPNEYKVLARNDIFYLISIRIIREGLQQDNHPSEQSLSDNDAYDWLVLNNGTIDDLRATAKTILQNYYGGL